MQAERTSDAVQLLAVGHSEPGNASLINGSTKHRRVDLESSRASE